MGQVKLEVFHPLELFKGQIVVSSVEIQVVQLNENALDAGRILLKTQGAGCPHNIQFLIEADSVQVTL